MELQDIISMQESHKWLSWKALPEGTYLAVMPNLVPKDWDIKGINKTLIENRVMNFDISKIESVIRKRTGKMELIGPPFELFEEEKRKYIHLQATPLQVRFSVDITILKSDYQLSKADILFLLAEKSVVYGINYDIIEEILSKEVYGREFIIAIATPPVMGADAIITETISIDPDVKPFLDESGNADYKKWGNIRQVKEGDIICTRVPPTPGIPGTSVYGQPLSPSPGEDFALPIGSNTKVIDNETKLVASINGFLYRNGRDICVGNVYIIQGDVDFKTGNIEYSGDVLVKGNVNEGFSVIADGNISVDGFVEAAHIESRKGSVFLKGSVFGLNKTTIIAEKNITAQSIQDSYIKAGKNLIVSNQIRGCKIETENLEMPRIAHIISSSVAFKGRVKCGTIGGKTESMNEFIFVENEREQLKEELQQLNEMLQKLSKAISILQQRLSVPDMPNSAVAEQRKLFISQLHTCNYNKEQLEKKRKNLLRLIEVMPDKDGLIVIRRLSPILKLTLYGTTKEYKQELVDLKISWRNGMAKMEPI
ncbi:MAG: FapA family protein [Fibromonadaceae bacterium]|jgi:uncharacterized protein (DUF342 family)|nr:FapA family protein [Fibromonadaceae bacterium]